jgi:hypothetical protein
MEIKGPCNLKVSKLITLHYILVHMYVYISMDHFSKTLTFNIAIAFTDDRNFNVSSMKPEQNKIEYIFKYKFFFAILFA